MSYVLVVDDEESIRKVLRYQLEQWGYKVRVAPSATEALQMLLSEPASIAILDIRMPGHDGLWLLERIRKTWSHIAVIMATGADDIALVEQSRKLGAVDYVLKPFDKDMLRQAMQRAASAAETP